MEIQHIELENIGCFENRRFDFSNLTVIFGENRTGKSTLVYALFFVLFGKHLHKRLKIEDLCRKGETFGTVTLYFKKDDAEYKLRRSTAGEPGIYKKTEDMTWQPVHPDIPMQNIISIPAEAAALTSFFREGELIYFLEDLPKHNNYNKTVLEKMLGLDDALMLRLRFKKTLAMAKQAEKMFQDAGTHKKPVTYEMLQASKKEVAETSAKYEKIDNEHKKLLLSSPNIIKFDLLIKEYNVRKKAFEDAVRLKENMLPIQELEQKKMTLEKQLIKKDAVFRERDELQRQIGGSEKEVKDLQSRIDKLKSLEKQPACFTCEQPLPTAHLSGLIPQLERQKLEAVQNHLNIKEALEKNKITLKEFQTYEKQLNDIYQDIKDVYALDKQITSLKDHLNKAEADLNQFKQDHPDIKDENLSPERLKAVEAERSRTEKKLINDKAKIKQLEDDIERNKAMREKLNIAKRNVTVCDVAYHAFCNAIQELSRDLLNQVRENVRTWSEHFSFLHQFDIEITDRELLPIIQAKGYQYKLNQMSKSERIFLYLLLKLAFGDALGNLGIFMLDDPADGLDLKRKQTLAYLLAEISQKRQILLTTNDDAFTDLFPQSLRINL